MLKALAVHHRNILTGSTLNMDAELEAGAGAARVLLNKYSEVFAGSGQMMSAVVSEILDRGPSSTAERGCMLRQHPRRLLSCSFWGRCSNWSGRCYGRGPSPTTPLRSW